MRVRSVLGPAQFWVLLTGLLLIVIGSFYVFGPGLAERYVLEIQGPPLEKMFGFRAGYVPSGRPPHMGRVFALTEVFPGGLLDRAGFRVGDRPSVGYCLFQGDYVAAKAFFDRLERVRAGEEISFTVADESEESEFRRLILTADRRGQHR